MKPVDQSRVSYEDGDCLRACIASVLELPLADVPEYSDDREMGPRYSEWLGRFNLSLMCIRLDPGNAISPGYHLIEGLSRNGKDYHVAVGLDGKIVHDPDPTSRGKFKGGGNYWIFVSIDPARTDLPAVVEALEEAQEQLKAIRKANASHHPGCSDGPFCTLPQEIARILKEGK